MRVIRFSVYTCILMLMICGSAMFFTESSSAATDNLVIVLDAGHDDAHTGAAGNNLNEEKLNLQIALACKEELETYKGVTVYMVRDTGTCPYGGQSMGSSVQCNKKRVEYAASVGADVYISLHNNSSTNTSAKGASVYYPTTNYNYGCGLTGGGLARAILDQLLTLGLKDRGISVRYSEDNTRYPDGSLADYYGVIKNSKLKGIPAIIVEHAFVSNASDAAEYLSTQEKLKTLGVLDATGIAKFYGLEKKVVLDYSDVIISGYSTDNETKMCLQAARVKGAQRVEFVVWSNENGQDDLRNYSAVKDSKGNWITSVPIANHGSEGEYQVEVYANGNVNIGKYKFHVEGPSAGRIEVLNPNHQQGTFVVEAAGVYSGTDIDSVSIAVWNEAAPDKVKWFQGVDRGNAFYEITGSISEFNYQYGKYIVHTYVRDKNNIAKCVGFGSVTLECPDATVAVSGDGVSAVYRAEVSNVPYGDGVKEVAFRVSPVEVSQDAVTADYVTENAKVSHPDNTIMSEYEGVKKSSGCWNGSIYPAEIGDAGYYKLQAYGKLSTNQEVLLGETTFYASAPEQKLQGHIRENGTTLWKGKGLELISNKSMESIITVNPWCDYGTVAKVLKQSNELYKDYVAYELISDITDAGQITLDIPEFMHDREIVAYQIISGESGNLISLEGTFSKENGKLTIQSQLSGLIVIAAKEARLYGDANYNNKIELQDAQMVLKAALNIVKLDAMVNKYCDVNQDGKVNLQDAQLILKKALNIIKEF